MSEQPPVGDDGPRWEDEVADLIHPPIPEDARDRGHHQGQP